MNQTVLLTATAVAAAIAVCAGAAELEAPADTEKLWYDQPATNWMTEALPLGNGRVVGMFFGSVSREAAYELCENLRPEATRLIALSKLVLGYSAARDLVTHNLTITIDGCKHMCAAKMVNQSGGTVAQEVAVLDVYRRHKELKPEGIAELNQAGLKLARVLAEEVAATLDQIRQTSPTKGAHHV